jgi:hypothetical protein
VAYSGIIRRILISCPGDVPESDLAIIRQAINRWNGIYGENFATSVVPISWGEHAAAEFGRAPQELLNEQLVDVCDGCIAIFANRLGTATAVAESGTAEEIERLAEAGKHVAILRSTRPVDGSRIDYDQGKKLDQYLTGISSRALILKYSSDSELSHNVETILVRAVSRDAARTELQINAAAAVAEVWPRVESTERLRTTSRGVQTSRDWFLVLANTGDAPANNVRFQVADDSWQIASDARDDEPDVRILAPGSDARFPIFVSMGTAPQTDCTVTWEDARGEQSNTATLRI